MSTEGSAGLAADSHPHNSEDPEMKTSRHRRGDFQSVRCLNATARQIKQHLSDMINGRMDRLSGRHGRLDSESDTADDNSCHGSILSSHHTHENKVTNMTHSPPEPLSSPSSHLNRLLVTALASYR